VPPKDPANPFDAGKIIDVEVHICSDRSDYRITVLADGVEDQLYEGTRSDGWAGVAAMRRLKIAP